MDPGGVTGANQDSMDLTNCLLDAAGVFMDPGSGLDGSMVLVDVLVDPGGVTGTTLDLVDLSIGL